VDDGIDLAVGQVLRFGQAHVRRFRIEILADFSLPAAVVAVADSAIIGEVSPRLAEILGLSVKGFFALRSDDGTASLRIVLAM
jgi:hypothetical protein